MQQQQQQAYRQIQQQQLAQGQPPPPMLSTAMQNFNDASHTNDLTSPQQGNATQDQRLNPAIANPALGVQSGQSQPELGQTVNASFNAGNNQAGGGGGQVQHQQHQQQQSSQQQPQFSDAQFQEMLAQMQRAQQQYYN